MPAEYEHIVEFSFNPKQNSFVVRFLDGKSCVVEVINLPKKLQTKKPEWDKAVLSADKTAICFQAGNEIREIPAYIIHSKGTEV